MADAAEASGLPPDSDEMKMKPEDHDSPESDPGDNRTTSPQLRERKKRTRLRQACDACRLRKVRCDEGNPPCKPCQAQGLLCAYTRARKKPGPPVRRTKDLPRAYPPETNGIEQTQPSEVSAAPISAPTTRLVSLPPGSDQSEGVHRAQRTPSNATSYASFGPHFPELAANPPVPLFGTLSPVINSTTPFPALPAFRMDVTTDLLLPRDVLKLLLKDFFYYIYPLNPVVHEPSFIADLNAGRDKSDPMFLFLIFCMCTVTIISFPRKLQSYCQGRYYQTAIQMAERSHRLALLARPVDYLERIDVTHLAGLYLLALSAWYSNKVERGTYYYAELSLAITLLERKLPSSQLANDFTAGFMQSPDVINAELRKRVFWIVMVGEISRYSMEGRINLPLFFKYSSSDLDKLYLDTVPAELDDAFITPTGYDYTGARMDGNVSHIVGYNACSKIHLIYAKYVSVTHIDETGVWRSMDPELKRRVLKTFLTEIKTALDWLPPELKLDMRMAEANAGTDADALAMDMVVPWPASATTDGDIYLSMQAFLGRQTLYQRAAELPDGINIPDPDRHEISYEVQKANLYVTQLYLFSIFLSDYAREVAALAAPNNRTMKFVNPVNEIDVSHDTDYICRAMLVVMRCIKFEHLEPNGQSIIAKIRIIAASLLHDIRSDAAYGQQPSTPSSTSSFASKARTEAYLVAFLELLSKLAGENHAEDRGWLQGIRNET